MIDIVKRKPLNELQRIDLVKRLQMLLDNGFTLSESFEFIFEQFDLNNKNTKDKLSNALLNGANCYEVFTILNYPKQIIMLVYFAELFGDLAIYLKNVEDFLTRKYQTKQKFLKTIQYPTVLFIVFITLIIILNNTIIPEFNELYNTMGVQLSTTQSLFTAIIFKLPLFIFIFIITTIIFIILARFFYQRTSISLKHKIILTIPILKKLFIRYKTYRLATEFSLFYKNGITLQNIVEIYKQQHDDPYLNFIASEINEGIRHGSNLSQILEKFSCFEEGLIKFIKAGEKQGKLEIELRIYSEIIISKIENQLQLMIKIIQPVIFSILACLIVLLYLIIMLPMFDLMQTIK
nr:competence type IV pilus assembly protein ComGB [Staphylococcus sp. ACRSN]